MKRKEFVEVVFNGVFFACGMLSVAFVVGITAYLIASGIPAIAEIGPVNFLLGQFGTLAKNSTAFCLSS